MERLISLKNQCAIFSQFSRVFVGASLATAAVYWLCAFSKKSPLWKEID
jgi:hypothetical protein